MSIENGSQLGSYMVVEPLGVGGMGEVYRATDTKLDREVAIKVLPDAMAHDPERVARFEREAKVLAQLNHPMIAAIHGFDEANGKRFLVLELVEGPTLADRLRNGRLPVEECLDIARQIAQALEVAHEKGIIHRDLKPANVKVTEEGEVKVLDFGLAKALVEDEASLDPASSPTITNDFTAPGVILGTAAYMSPEQARGRPVDKRTDVWSFGCVLYECLTGDSMFRGETVTDSIGAILHKQPDWKLLPAETPPTVQLLLRRCLAKDRKRRLRDIGDVRLELEAAIADPTSSMLGLASAAIAAEGKTSLLNTRGVAPIMGAVLLTAMIAVGVGRSLIPKPPAPVTERYAIVLPHRESEIAATRWPMFAVSNDGRLLSYVASSEADYNRRSIFRRRLDTPDPAPLVEGAGRPCFPTFSPDGKWLAYYERDNDELLKVSVDGGPRTKLHELRDFVGMSWTMDGSILFARQRLSGVLFRIGENGGSAEEITLPDAKDKFPRFPHVTPDGKAVLYALSESALGTDDCSIEVYSFETQQSHTVVNNGTFPFITRSGHLLFIRESTLMVASFDAETLQRTSEPVPAVSGIELGTRDSARIALTDNGTLYYRQGEAIQRESPQSICLYTLEGNGKPELFSDQSGQFNDFSISPDGSLIALEIKQAGSDKDSVWLLDTSLNVLAPLSTEPGDQESPIFSPDGSWVYYSASDENNQWLGLYRRRSDHSGTAELVEDGPRPCWIDSISPDGQRLYVTERPSEEHSPGTNWDLAVVQLGEDDQKATREPWYQGESYQPNIQVSPNGRWVAYMSGHAGGPHLYVKQSSGEGAVHPISSALAAYPIWSPDGRKIYFQTVEEGKARLLAVDVLEGADVADDQQQPTFKVGETTQVMELGSARGSLSSSPRVRILPDGKAFLRIDNAPDEGGQEDTVDDKTVIHVWRNFFAELERLAPTKK